MRRHRRDPKMTWLASIPPFAHLSAKELETLASTADHATVPAGRVVMRQGDPGHEAFVIVEGEAEVVRDGERIATLGPGDLAGEHAIIAAQHRNADVVAVTDLDIAVFEQRAFERAMDEAPHFHRQVDETVERRGPTP